MNEKYDPNNIFAKILRGELPCNKIYEDDYVLSFYDKYPTAPIHALVITRDPYISYSDFIERAKHDDIANFFASVKNVVKMLELDKFGYKLLTNCGASAGQAIFHFHIHLMSNGDGIKNN